MSARCVRQVVLDKWFHLIHHVLWSTAQGSCSALLGVAEPGTYAPVTIITSITIIVIIITSITTIINIIYYRSYHYYYYYDYYYYEALLGRPARARRRPT